MKLNPRNKTSNFLRCDAMHLASGMLDLDIGFNCLQQPDTGFTSCLIGTSTVERF